MISQKIQKANNLQDIEDISPDNEPESESETFLIDFTTKLYYPSLKKDREVDIEESKRKLFDLMFQMRALSIKRKSIKEKIDELVKAIPDMEDLEKERSTLDDQYKEIRNNVEIIIEEIVNHDPDIKPSVMKDEYAGASFKKNKDVIYPESKSAVTAKKDLHDWLVEHGEYENGRYYIKVGDKSIESLALPVIKVTPTLPS